MWRLGYDYNHSQCRKLMNRERLSYSHYTERRLGNDYSYSQIQKNMTYDSGDDYPSRPTRGFIFCWWVASYSHHFLFFFFLLLGTTNSQKKNLEPQKKKWKEHRRWRPWRPWGPFQNYQLKLTVPPRFFLSLKYRTFFVWRYFNIHFNYWRLTSP